MSDVLLQATALEQAALVRSRRVSSEELTRLYLDRIERLNPRIGAFVQVFAGRALRDARRKDTAVRRSRSPDELPPFHGVPTGIKDLNFVRFSTTRFGSRAVRFWSPLDDRTVASVRRGGFVILGKLATSELGAMPVTETAAQGPTRNPWDLSASAGGSSGGSGAAVAGALVPIAPGSDGAGSIRIPSSFCHLYGIKPSRGRVANHLGLADRTILYTSGPMARTVGDAAAMLDALSGISVGRPHWQAPPPRPFAALAEIAPEPLRIHLVTKNPLATTHPEVLAAVLRVARTLESLGHHIEEAEPPEASLEEFLPIWQKVVGAAPFVDWSRTEPITRWLGEAGRKLDAREVAARQAAIEVRLRAAFGGADAWLTPTVPHLPPRIGTFATQADPAKAFAAAAELGSFTAMFNILGFPAASLPAGVAADGRPIGAQIACRDPEDARVLAISRQLEEAMPWRDRRAPLATEHSRPPDGGPHE